MALEELFSIDIPDKDAIIFVTVRQALNYIVTKLLLEKQYVLLPSSDIASAFDSIKTQVPSVQREINTIISSKLFSDYLRAFQLNKLDLSDLLYNLVQTNWIEHVTTVPDISKDGMPLGAYIIFLTKRYLYIVTLKSRAVHTNRLNNVDAYLDVEHKYEGGKLSMIAISMYYSKNGQSLNLDFRFTNQAGLTGANEFLRKYYLFLDQAT